MNENQGQALTNLINELKAYIDTSTNLPFSNKIWVNSEELVEYIDRLEEAVPKEIYNARKILDDQSRVLAKAHEDAAVTMQKAKAEAEEIINNAKREAEYLVEKEQIIIEARARAAAIRNEAYEFSEKVRQDAADYEYEMRKAALHYVETLLHNMNNTVVNMESQINSFLATDVANMKQELEHNLKEVNDRVEDLEVEMTSGYNSPQDQPEEVLAADEENPLA